MNTLKLVDGIVRRLKGTEPEVSIPRWMETVPEKDPVRIRLEWRIGLVKRRLQSNEEDSNGKKESK